MKRKAPLTLLALALVASTVVVGVIRSAQPASAGSLSAGSVTMVSANKDRTDSAPGSGTFASDEVAISDDGSVVAFVSKTPAEQLVNDPLQTGKVTDTNGVEDIFVWDSRVPAPIGPVTTLVSWNASHTGTGGGVGVVNPASIHPIIAPLGLGIVFESRAKDLTTTPVISDKNLYAWLPLVSDVFPLFLVNVDKTGTTGSDSTNYDPSIAITPIPPSAKVAFTSNATDLVNENSHSVNQVYVRDFVTQTTTLVSKATDGNGTVSGADDPMIAASGFKVAFASGGGDLKAGISGSGGNIWTRDLLTSTTTLISENQAGTDGTSGNGNPVISADGTSVAWDGNDPLLSSTVHNGNNHIWYKNGANPVQMVDTNFTGLLGCNVASNNPGLSVTGNVVLFESFCSDIVPPGVADDSGTDVFARYFPAPAPVLISVNKDSNASGNADSFICPGSSPPNCGASTNAGAAMNADGSAITFFSQANDIVPPVNGTPPFSNGNVFVRYPFTNTTINLTQTAGGKNPDGTSRDAVIAKDGGTVAFVSLADDLVTPDTNGGTDAFISDLKNTIAIQPVNAVNEGDGTVSVTVLRTGNNGTTDTVDYETGDGLDPGVPLPVDLTSAADAMQPGDYTEKTGTLTFGPGETMKTITVSIQDDPTAEPLEAFRVKLSSPSGGAKLLLPGPLNQTYVGIIDNDVPQTFQFAVSQQTPASAQVGDTVTMKAMLTADAGGSALDVSALAAGAATAGFDMVSCTATPFSVPAGTSQEVTCTARLTGAPGSATNKLSIDATGKFGVDAPSTKTATSNAVTSTAGVSATLTATDDGDGNAAHVELADKITYTLTLTNDSDTPAQLTGLPAGFTAPTGTTQATRVDGSMTIAAGGTSTWTLTVDVDDTSIDGATITGTATGVQYAMSAIGLAATPVVITPANVVSTVDAPVVAVSAHTLTDNNAGNLAPGDTVDVSVTVTNTGAVAATSASLVDTLTDLANPTNVKLGGVNCAACTIGASSVTAPLGGIPAGGSKVLTFTVTVPAVPSGSIAKSSAVVTFAPATTGASPTTADEANLAIAAGAAPVAANDSFMVDEDQTLTVLLANSVLGNDADAQNDPLTAIKVDDSNAHGTVTFAADGTFTYQPDANFNGAASFTYKANDGTNDSNVATVTLTVNPVNDPPNVSPDMINVVNDGNPSQFNVLGNDSDPDGDTLAVEVTVQPQHGQVQCDAQTGVCTYTPDPGYTGPDSFTYAVNDGNVPHNSVTAAVTITVDPDPNATTTSTSSTTSSSTSSTSTSSTSSTSTSSTSSTSTSSTSTSSTSTTSSTVPDSTSTSSTSSTLPDGSSTTTSSSTTSSSTSSTLPGESTTTTTGDPGTTTTSGQATTTSTGSGVDVSGNNLGNSNGNVSATGTLPVTGNDSGLGVVIGLGAIVLGSMLLALRRRADRAR